MARGNGHLPAADVRNLARGNGHLPAADVRNLARGEDARVAGVVDLARRNGCPPRRALLIWRGGKTPALRAFMTCEGNGHLPAADVRNLARGKGRPPRRALLIWRGGTDGRHGGRLWIWHRRHRRRRRGQSRQHQSGRAPQIYRQTKNKTRHGSPQTGCLL